jgi:ERCC4-related helicase
VTTPHQAKYFAHALTLRRSSDDMGKFAAALADAQVDLNPHQVDAALFAFRSPLSKGAILADEVGLGKTIEAGILLSQKWAERKRRLLIIVPASLRKQWFQELADKFFLPSVILEKKSFEAALAGNLNPFNDSGRIIICSYHFAKAKEPYLRQTPWDLVVVDEAHRLRNVYKPTNRIANILKGAISHAPKVLLTATPLQNSLLELYGLVSFIDEYSFGDLASFKSQYNDLSERPRFEELKARLKPICQRTLRRQVLEYIKFTKRIPITQEFAPSDAEQRLYDLVTDYLRQEHLYALPSGQRQLMTLILRKLLASSTFAIAGTLGGLAEKLGEALGKQEQSDLDVASVAEHFEPLEALQDEWVDDDEEAEDDENEAKAAKRFNAEDLPLVRQEIAQLREFQQLAESILANSKGDVLLQALEKGFAKAEELGAPRKAVIFTESTRTQDYLVQVLENSPYRGRVLRFNGTNANPQAREIYEQWLGRYKGTAKASGSRTADSRQALVDHFRDSADILVATEAAAEGINLQFCNLVVNYDLPWNPQRIEQRIGRCHRYGQKHDVVVVNFLNTKNEADQHVYRILDEKFKLFEGVFGASDEVLGSIASGVDFEKRISEILQKCRTPEEIQAGFDELQLQMDLPIQEKMADTERKLLENFDEEVQEKLRLSRDSSRAARDRAQEWLWLLTRQYLREHAEFREGDERSFVLKSNPFPGEDIEPGPYRLGKDVEDANLYRLGHPLARRIIEACKDLEAPRAQLAFEHSQSGRNLAALAPLAGQSGWLSCEMFMVEALEAEDALITVGWADDGSMLDEDQVQRMLSLPAACSECIEEPPSEALERALDGQRQARLGVLEKKNNVYFDEALEKLDRWADDQKHGLELELKDLDRAMAEAKKASRQAPTLDEKLQHQRRLSELESTRNRKRRELYAAQDAIEAKRGGLIKELEQRLDRHQARKPLFTVRWSVK